MEALLQFVLDHWAAVFGIVSLIAAIGVIIYQVKMHQNTIPKLQTDITAVEDKFSEKITQMRNELNSRLYRKDGQSVYMPRDGCKDCRFECSDNRNKEYTMILDYLKRLDDKLEKLSDKTKA